jgi:hypothetical protein
MRNPGQCLATLPAESVIQQIKNILDQPIIILCLVHRQVLSSLLVVRRPGDTISGFRKQHRLPNSRLYANSTDSADRNKAASRTEGQVLNITSV